MRLFCRQILCHGRVDPCPVRTLLLTGFEQCPNAFSTSQSITQHQAVWHIYPVAFSIASLDCMDVLVISGFSRCEALQTLVDSHLVIEVAEFIEPCLQPRRSGCATAAIVASRFRTSAQCARSARASPDRCASAECLPTGRRRPTACP